MIKNKSILGIRIDKLENDIEVVLDSLKGSKNVLIVTLDIYELLKAHRNKKLRDIIKNATLVIASHPAIAKAYNFINKETINYQKDFIFFSKLLSYAESRKMSFFLFGDEEKYFFTITEKIKKIYPAIHMVGNFQDTKDEYKLDKAFVGFKKIEPDLFIMHMDFKKALYWFDLNKENLDIEFCIPIKRPLDAFAGKSKSPDLSIIEKNQEGWFYLRKNIFRIFLVFDYIWFWVLVLFEKVFSKKDKNIS